jgi:GNAT superfamily N-acetyltransferase
MDIRQANRNDKEMVLNVLDKFNDFIHSNEKNWDGKLSTSASENSGYLFDEMFDLGRSKIFIAIEDNEAIGFLEIHKVPRFRTSKYYGEIEGMFVMEEYYGKGVAKELMKLAYNWAKEQKFDCVRLYSGFELERAHAFYKKMGFDEAGITFKNYNYNDEYN